MRGVPPAPDATHWLRFEARRMCNFESLAACAPTVSADDDMASASILSDGSSGTGTVNADGDQDDYWRIDLINGDRVYRLVLMLLGVLVLEMIVAGGSLEIPTTGKARSNSAIQPEMSCLSAR